MDLGIFALRQNVDKGQVLFLVKLVVSLSFQ